MKSVNKAIDKVNRFGDVCREKNGDATSIDVFNTAFSEMLDKARTALSEDDNA